MQIIYRHNIKVHFSTIRDAQAAMYNEYDHIQDLSKGGIVYPFTGIRGDSKELWYKVKQQQIPNVRLVKAESRLEQS